MTDSPLTYANLIIKTSYVSACAEAKVSRSVLRSLLAESNFLHTPYWILAPMMLAVFMLTC